ncbi:hypothetical protein OH693_25005 [Escherichia coli]|nr:hypothetical protein [Escherichia coli]
MRGVEKSFDKWLTGQPGECIVRKDRYGRVIEDISSTDSQAAHNLTLSIDERLAGAGLSRTEQRSGL